MFPINQFTEQLNATCFSEDASQIWVCTHQSEQKSMLYFDLCLQKPGESVPRNSPDLSLSLSSQQILSVYAANATFEKMFFTKGVKVLCSMQLDCFLTAATFIGTGQNFVPTTEKAKKLRDIFQPLIPYLRPMSIKEELAFVFPYHRTEMSLKINMEEEQVHLLFPKEKEQVCSSKKQIEMYVQPFFDRVAGYEALYQSLLSVALRHDPSAFLLLEHEQLAVFSKYLRLRFWYVHKEEGSKHIGDLLSSDEHFMKAVTVQEADWEQFQTEVLRTVEKSIQAYRLTAAIQNKTKNFLLKISSELLEQPFREFKYGGTLSFEAWSAYLRSQYEKQGMVRIDDHTIRQIEELFFTNGSLLPVSFYKRIEAAVQIGDYVMLMGDKKLFHCTYFVLTAAELHTLLETKSFESIYATIRQSLQAQL